MAALPASAAAMSGLCLLSLGPSLQRQPQSLHGNECLAAYREKVKNPKAALQQPPAGQLGIASSPWAQSPIKNTRTIAIKNQLLINEKPFDISMDSR
ncbi:hypothetical protein [Vandammella animalimorsus]|uniref:hypothetical protein n=1 Tax=Vandammella animalimorsus TaxID=2029117 RepID=UPI0011813D52|nr:hypothetical protein [Vandammella animalimorsus]